MALRLQPEIAPGIAIVAIGASAGGLEACTKLLEAMPSAVPFAMILVQHLDPTHDSLMVELLAEHTPMPVQQAEDGMAIAAGRLYVIPPGVSLAVDKGALRLSTPRERHGARLPFDFLLRSLAAGQGPTSACVVLSGSGSDGSGGVVALSAAGGLVIAQDPEEAGYDGMPRSAIATGAVALVLDVANIPHALLADGRLLAPGEVPRAGGAATPEFAAIIALLRTETGHDFSLYKPGTLARRIERRMTLTASADMGAYLAHLRRDADERTQLASDLLINVTSFFRDPAVFARLAEDVIPAMIRGHKSAEPLRVWVAGCSTGEETYSLAMLFREGMAELRPELKLQIFASDVDEQAVATARAGHYPATTAGGISAARLARFFTREEGGYRVLPELRSAIVFTVQDVLADPPFSRLDFVSCRNLLIYLRPEAQARVVGAFHFALRQGGILLLGTSETVGDAAGRFELVSKGDRLYRHVGRSRAGDFPFPVGNPTGAGIRARIPAPTSAPSRLAALATLGQRLVLDAYAPASVLLNARYECLYALGPVERFLQVAPGHATLDVLALAREGIRPKLRLALKQAAQENARVTLGNIHFVREGVSVTLSIDVQPVLSAGEALLLASFVEGPTADLTSGGGGRRRVPRVEELERVLAATRLDLQGAIHSLEVSSEEHKAVHEEALSVNEEFQSTNEELLTSKEELQSLNEELTALNSQLQETLERQRTMSNDLQNILYSTDVATLFLDTSLNIRFFTPATRALFNLIPGDIGRPLADLHSLAGDPALPGDARAVLHDSKPIECEIEAGGTWFTRRVLPYRGLDNGVEGVVITFTDITERKRTARALNEAKRQAEVANAAKSRFLASASHDLRQPLQTLTLIQGLMVKKPAPERLERLVARMDDTLGAMSGMLNTLLDINQIEAGIVQPEVVRFPLDAVLTGLRDEFIYHAEAKGLGLRVVPCGLQIDSDPRLLEQMLRNLLSNALKYTQTGRVLLGCRRWTMPDGASMLAIEVWDTGIGIPAEQFGAIFEEYRQLDNAARERSRGLGLGLPIVKRLGDLLGHVVRVASRPGRGAVFAIDVAIPAVGSGAPPLLAPPLKAAEASVTAPKGPGPPGGEILLIEDDPEVRELLALYLREEGSRPTAVCDGAEALDLMARKAVRPDVILADYNLPGGMNGVQLIAALRRQAGRAIPAVMLTGDTSAAVMRDIAAQECVQLHKPVRLAQLREAILTLMPSLPPAGPKVAGTPKVLIIDDDEQLRRALRDVLEDDGNAVEDYDSCEAFMAVHALNASEASGLCLLLDASLPGMSGIALLHRLRAAGDRLPAIIITGQGDANVAVEAMKAGAFDYLEKPVGRCALLAAVRHALLLSLDTGKRSAWRDAAAGSIAGLTERQRQVMGMVVAGHSSKNIAADLGISQRTVENHRAAIMEKTGSASLPALARLAMTAAWSGPAATDAAALPAREDALP